MKRPAEEVKFLRTVEGYTRNYTASPEVRAITRHLGIAIIRGISAAGKDHQMHKLMESPGQYGLSDINLVCSSVTRKPRLSDTYRRHYRIEEEAEREEVLGNLASGRYVQAISLHREMYATELEAYDRTGLNLAQYTAKECRRLKQKEVFSPDVPQVVLVPGHVDTWWDAWDKRDLRTLTPELKRSRLKEGQHSLYEAVYDPDVIVVANNYDDTAHLDIAAAITGVYDPDKSDAARVKAALVLKFVDSLVGPAPELYGTRGLKALK